MLWGILFCQIAGLGERPAVAQDLRGRVESDVAEVVRTIIHLFSQVGDKTRGEFLGFLNKLEYFNVESEIDRLVGSPWELSDSSVYKLSLAPQHIAYPVYDQLVAQMTRLDDLRTRRVQHLTVDAVPLIAVNLQLLDDQRSGQELLDSLLQYLNAREIVDIGVFLLASQPLFPKTDAEWWTLKRRIADRKAALALVGLGVGALFEAGAFNNSGSIRRFKKNTYQLGWYAGISRLGIHLRPSLRAGLTTVLPGAEVAAGLSHQVRPGLGEIQTALEVAVRESYLNRFSLSSGWNSFVQLAFRQVIADSSGIRTNGHTGRIGLFMKRPNPFHWPHIVFRASAETESNFIETLNFAVGLGVDYTKTGLSAVMQTSHTEVGQGEGRHQDLRTGVFIAGTMESPADYYVDKMEVSGRKLREAWESWWALETRRNETLVRLGVASDSATTNSLLESLGRQSGEWELARTIMVETLATYLERRRQVYSLAQWRISKGDLHGPVDGEILKAAATALFSRLSELSQFLERAVEPLVALRNEYTEHLQASERYQSQGNLQAAKTEEAYATDLERRWRQESTLVEEALQRFTHLRSCVQRVVMAAPQLAPPGFHLAPITGMQRKLIALVAQTLLYRDSM
jgi:hypothetical protein